MKTGSFIHNKKGFIYSLYVLANASGRLVTNEPKKIKSYQIINQVFAKKWAANFSEVFNLNSKPSNARSLLIVSHLPYFYTYYATAG